VRKSQFTDQQIVAALRQVEHSTTVGEVCRKLGVTEQTFYRWKRKFAGMGIAVFDNSVWALRQPW
jgi:putative transposase